MTELLVVLAIAGVLGMLAAPAMGGLLARSKSDGIESSVADSLRGARTAAVMHATRVVVCPSHDGRHCDPGYDWQHGWVVAWDADHDGEPDAGRPLLAVQQALPRGIRVATSAGRRRIVFHPNGDAAGSNANFTICDAQLREGRSIVVANTGRVRAAKPEPARLAACLAALR